jgi:hypothetical protein
VRREIRYEREVGSVIYQISWQTLPGLRGISCSEFRATPTSTPDYEGGVAVELAGETASETLVEQLEAHFEYRRFTNAADAFDVVRAYIIERSLRADA